MTFSVQDGERVKAGDRLVDGPLNPPDILAVLGENELQKYLVNQIQEVYRLQGRNSCRTRDTTSHSLTFRLQLEGSAPLDGQIRRWL